MNKSNDVITGLLNTYRQQYIHAGGNQPHWTDDVTFKFEDDKRKLYITKDDNSVFMSCPIQADQWGCEGTRGLLSQEVNMSNNLQPVWDWLQPILQERIEVYTAHYHLTLSQEARDQERFDVGLSAYLKACASAPDTMNGRDGFDINWQEGLQKLLVNPTGSEGFAIFERFNRRWTLSTSKAYAAVWDNSDKTIYAYVTDLLESRTAQMMQQAQPVVSCRSDEGVTQGLVDSIITMCRVLRHRDLSPQAVQEALKDLASDEDFAYLKAVVEGATGPTLPKSGY